MWLVKFEVCFQSLKTGIQLQIDICHHNFGTVFSNSYAFADLCKDDVDVTNRRISGLKMGLKLK